MSLVGSQYRPEITKFMRYQYTFKFRGSPTASHNGFSEPDPDDAVHRHVWMWLGDQLRDRGEEMGRAFQPAEYSWLHCERGVNSVLITCAGTNEVDVCKLDLCVNQSTCGVIYQNPGTSQELARWRRLLEAFLGTSPMVTSLQIKAIQRNDRDSPF